MDKKIKTSYGLTPECKRLLKLNMHFCKPHAQYFQEILEKVERRPEQCLMVGNDILQDFGCRKLGIGTFLVEQGRVIGDEASFRPDFRGTLDDLRELVSRGTLEL